MLKRTMNNNKPKFIVLLCILYVTQLTQCKVISRQDGVAGPSADANSITLGKLHPVPPRVVLNKDGTSAQPAVAALESASGEEVDSPKDKNGSQCWISLNEPNFFEEMDALDKKYKDVREAYVKKVDTLHFNKRMLDAMLLTRGTAERAVQKFHGNPNTIPAGLNLGSYCMFRLPGSILFFYRLKLRNDTRFTVNYIHNDVEQFTLTMRLSLNDLHLLGQYERALTSSEDPSRLYYRPNKGEVEFLLKDVKYKVEGRYRLLDDRLHIEHMISEIPPMPILMRYTDDPPGKFLPMSINPAALGDYLDRMQNDLDLWLKDYFNDFLMLYGFEEAPKNEKIQQYEDEKAMIQNQFTDEVMEILNDRVRSLMGSGLVMPNFMLTAVNGMEIRLYDGTVRGADSMYRRSVATGKGNEQMRYLDADIGFSGLKAEYRYDTYVRTGLPPISGVFVLNADDISAHMALQLVNYKPSTADLQITFMKHGKPESLTIEGPANRIVANFNHLLEHHIITIMSTTLIHHIRSLSSLTKCDPQLPTKDDGPNLEQRNEIHTNTDDNADYDVTTPITPDDYDTTGPSLNTDDSDETETTQHGEDGDGPTEPSQNSDDDSTFAPPDDNDRTDVTTNNDDGPTEPSEYTNNDDVPTPADNDGSSTPPDNDNDGPTVSSDNDDDVPNTPSANDDEPPVSPDNDDDIPNTPSSNDDEPPVSPDNDDVVPIPTTPSEIDDDGPTASPDNDDDYVPTAMVVDHRDVDYEYPTSESSLNRDDDLPKNHNAENIVPKSDFGFARKESIELELPPKPGSAKGESYKIDHNETFTMKKLYYEDQNGINRLK